MSLSAPTPLHLAYAGITERLRVVFPPAIFQHVMIPPKMSAQAWAGITVKMPMVGLGWDGIDPDRDNGREFQGSQKWTLYLATRNAGGIPQRFLGDKLGVGLFHMITAAVATLSGHTIAGLGTIQVADAQNVVSNEWDMATDVLGMLSLHIPTVMTPDAVLDDIEPYGWLRTLGIDWAIDGRDDAIEDVTPVGSAT